MPNTAGCTSTSITARIDGLVPPVLSRQGKGYTGTPSATLVGGAGTENFEDAVITPTLDDGEIELAFQSVCKTSGGSASCECSDRSGSGYASAPVLELSGGVSDYVSLLKGMTTDSVALKPRAGVVPVSELQYLDAMLPLPAAIRLVHSGSADIHFQLRYEVIELKPPGPVSDVAGTTSTTAIDLTWAEAAGHCRRNSTDHRPGTAKDANPPDVAELRPSWALYNAPEQERNNRNPGRTGTGGLMDRNAVDMSFLLRYIDRVEPVIPYAIASALLTTLSNAC